MSEQTGFRKLLGQLAKATVLFAYAYLWAPVRNRVRGLTGRCHTTVLLYHRVSDDYADSVTVGVEQFQRQLDILKRGYTVLDLPAALADWGRPRRCPAVVITFDDGYQDNYMAADLLRRAGLAATFFVATRIVGSEAAFPHDLKSLGRRVPALTWEQIGQMAHWGFDFGVHTAHHANVAQLPFDEAMAQIKLALEDLTRQGLASRGSQKWFAYPYGQPDDITDQVRSALGTCGIEYCFSAYGGVNGPDADPLDVKRQAVDHNFSDLAFRAAVEGWRVRR